MKLHDLRPAEGSNTARTRVGRGISAGKGKTAGRGTKGQKARAGGSIPPWFEGGQTPLHMRIPKLRGFKNRAKVDYEIVNVGDIAARIEAGAFAAAGTAPKKGEQLTINADILRAVGLVRNVKKPLKILGNGELGAALFVVADAFTKSATEKIEAAGGAVNVLEVPTESRPALGVRGGRAETEASAAAPEADSATADQPPSKPAARKASSRRPAAAAKDDTKESAEPDQPVDTVDSPDVTEEAAGQTGESADSETTEAAADDAGNANQEPLSGDDTETESAPTGDESA